MVAEMKVMEDENRWLKKMFAELSIHNELMKEALGKNEVALIASGVGRDSSDAKGSKCCTGLPYIRCE